MNASLLSLGFMLGMRHAMESDHVAAVASLATRSVNRVDTIRLATVWGVGHTLTLLLFCSLATWLDMTMPQRLAQGLELGVGLLLVGLGIDVLHKLKCESRGHSGNHRHDAGGNHLHCQPGRFPLRALLVGMMHGMAGSAALILLTLESTQSSQETVLYVLLFGIGSIAGMATLSTIIAVPLVYYGGCAWSCAIDGSEWQNRLRNVIGCVTACLGAWMVYDIGVTSGLLV